MASFTITEKGYNLKRLSGEFLPEVEKDLDGGPEQPNMLCQKLLHLLIPDLKTVSIQ